MAEDENVLMCLLLLMRMRMLMRSDKTIAAMRNLTHDELHELLDVAEEMAAAIKREHDSRPSDTTGV